LLKELGVISFGKITDCGRLDNTRKTIILLRTTTFISGIYHCR